VNNIQPVYIISAKRTPHGRFLGALSKKTSVELAVAAAKAALDGIDVNLIDQVIVGNVLAAGQGMNVARQIALRLQLPVTVPAFTVNMMCASGMQAVILAAQAIRSGTAEMVLCGGTESMSNAPYLLERARGGYKMGDGKLVDVLLRDGLIDPSSGEHMGLTAEWIVERYGISRQEQDQYARGSQSRYAEALALGRFTNELAPVEGCDADEPPRSSTTVESLSTLKPVFKDDGTVTAGNASGITDGAAMLVLCSEQRAMAAGFNPIAKFEHAAATGCDPSLMGLGPIHAVRKLCAQAGAEPHSFDLIELNEAFAAQAIACIRELGLSEQQTNPDGGAIAIGHPIGATGARLIVHLAHRLAQGQARSALATLCVGGGMGVAVSLQSSQN
jgi:acetyl-CoA C-acetyltransferase